MRREPIARLHERLPPNAVEVAWVERPPMDRHDGRGSDVARDLGGGAWSQVPRAEVRTPRPDRQKGKVHAAGHIAHLWITTGIAGEVHASAKVKDVADWLRPWRTRRDPVAGPNRLDRDAGNLDDFVRPDLDNFPRTDAGAPSAQAPGHDQGRTAGQAFERSLVKVVRVPMRDDHHVGFELGRVGEGTVALERAQTGPKERVRQDASSAELDQGGGVPDESNRDRCGRGRLGVRQSARRWGHRPFPGRGATVSGAGGA